MTVPTAETSDRYKLNKFKERKKEKGKPLLLVHPIEKQKSGR